MMCPCLHMFFHPVCLFTPCMHTQYMYNKKKNLLGKMILWAALFSCIEPIFAIAASLTFKDAFYCPLGKEEEANKKKLELSMGEYSDHIALAEALRRFEVARRRRNAGDFCREYFLSFNTLKLLSEMKTQFAQYLYEMKFLDNDNPGDRNANRNSNNIALIKAIVCAGLYPNIAVIRYRFVSILDPFETI